MLRLPKIRLVSPRSLAAAARLLAEAGPEGAALAGGTDLVPKLKRRQLRPRTLVDLSLVRGFSGVERRGGRAVIGAGTTIDYLLESPVLARLGALREAAALVATPQIRSSATVGGNLALDTRCSFYDQSGSWREAQGFCLKTDQEAPCRTAAGSESCFAVASGDLAPALIALGARVRLVGPAGGREAALEEIYQDVGSRSLRLGPGELIAAVELDLSPRLSAYRKLRRRGSFDFAALGVAVSLQMKDGEVSACRIVLGALASSPIVADEAAAIMTGGKPTLERAAEAARAAARRARPVENADFPAAYRRRMAGVFVARALRDLTGLGRAWEEQP